MCAHKQLQQAENSFQGMSSKTLEAFCLLVQIIKGSFKEGACHCWWVKFRTSFSPKLAPYRKTEDAGPSNLNHHWQKFASLTPLPLLSKVCRGNEKKKSMQAVQRNGKDQPEISSGSFLIPSSVAIVTAAVIAEFHSIPSSTLSSDTAIWVMLPAQEKTCLILCCHSNSSLTHTSRWYIRISSVKPTIPL